MSAIVIILPENQPHPDDDFSVAEIRRRERAEAISCLIGGDGRPPRSRPVLRVDNGKRKGD